MNSHFLCFNICRTTRRDKKKSESKSTNPSQPSTTKSLPQGDKKQQVPLPPSPPAAIKVDVKVTSIPVDLQGIISPWRMIVNQRRWVMLWLLKRLRVNRVSPVHSLDHPQGKHVMNQQTVNHALLTSVKILYPWCDELLGNNCGEHNDVY